MDEIDRAMDEKRRELLKSLKPTFDEDTPTAVEMMIAALWRDRGDLAKDEDRQKFLAALARLPKGCNSKPYPLVNRLTAFGLIFMDGGVEYHNSKRFDTVRGPVPAGTSRRKPRGV